METTALRLYGKEDLRLEKFELPEIKEDEILATVVTDSICMSSWKEAKIGSDHKKVPNDIAEKPIIVGHEFCGKIVKVGEKWKDKFQEGSKYAIQPNLQLPDRPDCPGYSFQYIGGDATYVIIPKEVMEQDCLLEYNGESYFEGSLLEPLSCVVGGFNANYHLIEGTYDHKMGIKENGNLMIMGGTGPMGLLQIDYALHGPIKPKTVVVTDLSDEKLENAARLYSPVEAAKSGIQLHYVNVSKYDDQAAYLQSLVDQESFDDIFVLAPVKPLIKQASSLLAKDGCLNFFAGPRDKEFFAEINLYDIHYNFTHYVGTSGGNTDDMRAAIKLVEDRKVNVEKVISHVLGLNAVAETTLNLPGLLPSGKKLIYVQKNMPRKSLEEIATNTYSDAFYQGLSDIIRQNNGLWSKKAEDYVLENAQNI
ncbi:zinc-binding dehydrogenase [Sporolactobacillus spathodeae]|uniref:Threonine dehydrogenase-like Zn-dependent dehydrogenase n=1 Tax=Sporolactobacillus spathodeae TaxID=1465502 RepID=A0ABS2Q9H5_9BACL|nr:zinc-binding dehydrogenase [Sporolactobacillus spathodeae]MBM7658443.1 threonine dehydrogenase-like Zn-dependent dehydrogenase [Sporolactobacillus spathodeae]